MLLSMGLGNTPELPLSWQRRGIAIDLVACKTTDYHRRRMMKWNMQYVTMYALLRNSSMEVEPHEDAQLSTAKVLRTSRIREFVTKRV